MTFDQLMQKGWKEQPPEESFAQWKERMEREIEFKIAGAPAIRRKLIENAPRSSPASRPATPQHGEQPVKYGECEICGHEKRLTRHHVIPKAVQRTTSVYRGMRNICRDCHDGVHLEFTNKQLVHEEWDEVVRKVRVRLALV